MKKQDIIVVIPAFNESEYIARVLKAVKPTGYEWVVVDDGSRDDTAQIAKKYGPTLIHKVNLGKGAAMKTGCEYAFGKRKAKAVVFMDSDAQHDPKELDLFLEELKKGAHVVLGVRSFDASMPWMRITGNRIASVLVNLIYGKYIPDIPSGYKALTKWGYEHVKWDSTDYSVELEIAVNLAKRKITFATVPITTIYIDLTRGFHFLDTLRILFNLVAWRFTK